MSASLRPPPRAADADEAALALASPERRARVDPHALIAALTPADRPGAAIRLRGDPALTRGRGPGVEARRDRDRGEVALHLAAGELPLLLGPTTPLPLALAEAAIGEDRQAERLRDLLDALQAPLLGALLGAHETFAPSPGGPATTLWEDALLALAGLDDPGSALPRRLRLRLLPRLLTSPPSASTLAWAVLQAVDDLATEDEGDADRWPLRVEVEAPCATHVRVDPRDRPRLGAATARLGERALLGARVRLGEGLRIHLRGLPPAALAALRPGSSGHRRIAALVGHLAPAATRWELAIHLDAPPSLRLGAATPLGVARLANARRRRPRPAIVAYAGDAPAQEAMDEATP